MSLHDAAKHLAAHGRGDDKVLIHMTKGEVNSLNDLAMAHGGQLTINPHTGLPEAGFLSGLLPMMLGAGLAAATGGSSLLIGAGIGGLQAARTGSIGKGLMAGLGAWGGAGLAGGLVGAGASSVGQTASALGTPAATGAGSQASMLAAQNAGFGQAGLQSLGQSAAVASGAAPVVGGVGSSLAAGLANPSASIAAMGGGATAAKMAGAAALPSVIGEPKTPTAPTPDKEMGQRYSFTGNQPQATPAPDVPTYEDMLTKQGNFGRQQNYFATPTYTAINPTEAKDLYHFAGGGPVEMMSNQNALGANTMYPMANMTTSAFATPYQDPRSTNMMSSMAPAGGGTVNAMSGEPNMQGTRLASGGNVELHGHFSADGGQGGGGGFGGQGANGYQSVGAGGSDGGNYNSSLGVSGPPNFNGMRDPGYQQMQQMNQPQGFGPRGPATFNQDYLNTMASLRGQPSSPLAPAAPVQEAPVGIGPPVFAMADGGISGNVDFEAPQSPHAGPLEQLIRMIHAKQTGGGPMEEAKKYEYNPEQQQYQQMATGGISDAHFNLGGYSDGGRLLRGPGDGVSDSIPATIGHKQPARLADGEFVVPARIVSELGNGSTEAGARKLYAMMDRVQAARKKTVGKDKVAHNSRADKYLPA